VSERYTEMKTDIYMCVGSGQLGTSTWTSLSLYSLSRLGSHMVGDEQRGIRSESTNLNDCQSGEQVFGMTKIVVRRLLIWSS